MEFGLLHRAKSSKKIETNSGEHTEIIIKLPIDDKRCIFVRGARRTDNQTPKKIHSILVRPNYD